ncbi:MAG: hypothetical protein ABR558_02220 [Thioalkalivibrio sp.]
MAHHDITTPVSEETIRSWRVNDTVTLNAGDESIVLWIDSEGAGTVVLNVGSVALS